MHTQVYSVRQPSTAVLVQLACAALQQNVHKMSMYIISTDDKYTFNGWEVYTAPVD